MKDWFYGLEERERQFVSAGVIAVFVAVIYSLIWSPLQQKHARLQEDIVRWERAIGELRPLANIAKNTGTSQNTRPRSSQQTPLIVVDEALKSMGLDRYRRNSQPTSSNGIRITFVDVAFDELIVWLGNISEQHALNLQNGSFTADSTSVSGRINATLTLERSL